jgi:NAD-dependent protein deacetylase/lipoamidase
VWRFYAPRFATLTRAEPNAAHLALAALERRGLLSAVVTQNIDLLHTRAGSRDVVEVHGSIRTSTCSRCGRSYPLAEVLPLIEAGGGAPRCADDGAVLKPDVVFFGELLPEAAIDRAFDLARTAGLLLVVGSSLEVFPVAGLPLETIDAGGLVAIVNRGPTAQDARAALKVDAAAGEVLAGVVEQLREAAAIRRSRRSSSSRPQPVQTVRATSYGMPACWRSVWLVTGVCRWLRGGDAVDPVIRLRG